ncbi:MAG: hypothetical protein ACLFR1_10955 [Spirochaetia bacterium]
MKPPFCIVCKKRIEENQDAGIVYFKKNKKDLLWDKKAKQRDFVGHPPYCGWFCEEHYSRARELSHKTLPQAVRQIRSE